MAYSQKKKQNDNNKPQAEFAKGVNVKVQETKFGDIIKLGINVEAIMENPINEAGFINIELKKSKSGNLYAVVVKPQE